MSADPVAMLIASVLRAQRIAPRRPLMLDMAPDVAATTGITPERWTAVEPWKPNFDALRAAGFDPRPALGPGETGFDLAILRLGRQRARNLARIAEAVRRVCPGARVVVAGTNTFGAASYATPLGRPPSLSKHHCRAYWFARETAPADELLARWEAAIALRRCEGTDHVTAPGLFAWDRIDPGSALFARTLSADLAGEVADLGAGWGYLAREVLARCPAVRHVDLFEADWHALEAARANLAAAPAHFHWHDITHDLPRDAFDVIVSNPPFHATRHADPAIGQRVIRVAATALRLHGSLWLVANRHLPYEATLRAHFAQVDTRTEAGGYKVIVARVPRRQNVPG